MRIWNRNTWLPVRRGRRLCRRPGEDAMKWVSVTRRRPPSLSVPITLLLFAHYSPPFISSAKLLLRDNHHNKISEDRVRHMRHVFGLSQSIEQTCTHVYPSILPLPPKLVLTLPSQPPADRAEPRPGLPCTGPGGGGGGQDPRGLHSARRQEHLVRGASVSVI